ncbi:MAG: TrkH family potassium uptake protein [Candidatus Cryptobacteroides sp.]|nr:TrkH family potassium uptake protein [Candidatus Cryptobacteroides sp.]
MDIKVISVNVGKALLVSALFMFLSLVVSLSCGMDEAFGSLLISFLITLTVGAFPFIFVRKTSSISMSDGFLIITISWLLSFVFGMLPYLLYGGEFTFVNALFESVSGYTTTGFSILKDVEALPKSLLFWRSSTHFIGGLGVIVFLLLILPESSPFRLRITNLELSSLSREGYRYRSSRTVRIMCTVYIGLVVVETLLLWAAGMSFFDAINHSFSTIATGGFSTRNASIAYYDSKVIEAIVFLFMLFAGMHFGLIFTFVTTGSFKVFKHPVMRFYLITVAVMTFFVACELFAGGGHTVGSALWDSAFQVVSALTSTGFTTTDVINWPVMSSFLILCCGIQCACSGSTTGGIKTDRMLIAVKAIGCEIKKRLHPNSVYPVRVGNHPVNDENVTSAILYITLYLLLAAVSVVIFMIAGSDLTDSLAIEMASIGNVGFVSMGSGDLAGLPVVSKLLSSFNMFLGRVEIYPVLIVIYMMFNRKGK